MMDEPTNEGRAERARVALVAYCGGSLPEDSRNGTEIMQDLLADLMHLLEMEPCEWGPDEMEGPEYDTGARFSSLAGTAALHFEAELEPERDRDEAHG